MGWIMIAIILIICVATNFNIPSVVRAANDTSNWIAKQLPRNTTTSQNTSSTVNTGISVSQGARKNIIPTLERVNYGLNHLMQQCPYASICDQKGMDTQSQWKTSCCLPCSCNPICTTIGNCCIKNSTKKGSTCHATHVEITHSHDDDAIEFFMVDTCLNSRNLTDCKAVDTYPWGPLYPVYDPSTELIFFNEHCAECSGISAYTRWDLTITCETDEFSNNLYIRALNGNECKLEFFPPPEIELKQLEKHVCSNTLISSCNVSGLWSTYDAKLEEACSRYYAPVANYRGILRYSNRYCELCNGHETLPESLCDSLLANLYPERTNTFLSLTTLISFEMISNVMERPKLDDAVLTAEKHCGKHMVKHPSKAECRTILCPSGFIRIGDSCEAISTLWFRDSYFIQLELTPASNRSLPLSYLEGLNEKEQNNPKLWLNSRGIPPDYFRVFVEKFELENNVFVRKMIMQIGRKKYPLNIAKETESIRKALKQMWEIALKGEIFSFSVKFDKFSYFVYDGLAAPRYDVVAYIRNRTLVYEKMSTRKLFQEISRLYSPVSVRPVVLRRVNICEKVRLLESEWTSGFQQIQLHTSLTGSNSEKTLGDSEFDIYLNDHNKVVVEICVEDFNIRYNTHASGGSLVKVYNDPVWYLFGTLLAGLFHMAVTYLDLTR